MRASRQVAPNAGQRNARPTASSDARVAARAGQYRAQRPHRVPRRADSPDLHYRARPFRLQLAGRVAAASCGGQRTLPLAAPGRDRAIARALQRRTVSLHAALSRRCKSYTQIGPAPIPTRTILVDSYSVVGDADGARRDRAQSFLET